MIRGWLRERAPAAYAQSVEIKYVGGDPRVAFASSWDEECYVNGELVGTERVEEVGEETNIKTFSVERLEEFLHENGIDAGGLARPPHLSEEEL